jgi:protein-disulfide isomerase
MSPVVASYASSRTYLKLLIALVLTVVGFQGPPPVYAQSDDNVVAMVNGRKITQLEVDKSVTAKLGSLQQQIYDLRKTALENLILRIVLEDEAKKRSISVDDLKRELSAAKVEVPQSEVEQTYAENLLAFGNMSPDEAKERLRLDLESKARMRNYREKLLKLRESSHVKSTLDEPSLPIGNIIDKAPFRGGNAPLVNIIEFSDFQCPYCKEAQATILKLSLKYGNQVKFVFKHLPLAIHPEAFSASKAAFCAGEQGKFWQYHDALFASDSLALEALTRTASQLGLNSQKFKNCFDSAASNTAVLRDMQDAQQLGIDGTPTFIVNGTLYRGALNFEDFSAIIENKLTLAKTPLPPE